MRWEDSSKTPAVLIVEDEPLVRLGAVRAIKDAGFEVIEAANADEAIRILEPQQHPSGLYRHSHARLH